MALPDKPQDGLSTTIIEQAGSILIKAEKRNVKHFQLSRRILRRSSKEPSFASTSAKKAAALKCSKARSKCPTSRPDNLHWCFQDSARRFGLPAIAVYR